TRPPFERVVDRPDQSRTPGYAVLRRFEPRLQGVHQRLRLGLPDRAALVGVETPDPLLDRVDGCNALDDLPGEGRVRRLVDFDEVPTRVNETKRQADFSRRLLVARQRGIGGITVDLQHALEPGQLRKDLLLAPTPGSAPRSRRRLQCARSGRDEAADGRLEGAARSD